jgi:hypothetical protein
MKKYVLAAVAALSLSTGAQADQSEFDRAYQQCVDTVTHANEDMLAGRDAFGVQHNDWPPEVMQSVQRKVAENLRNMRRDCIDNAHIVEWCHGNDNCIGDGLVAQDWAKKEGRPMTQRD